MSERSLLSEITNVFTNAWDLLPWYPDNAVRDVPGVELTWKKVSFQIYDTVNNVSETNTGAEVSPTRTPSKNTTKKDDAFFKFLTGRKLRKLTLQTADYIKNLEY